MIDKTNEGEQATFSILHLICGLPGSGKTTLSKRLEVIHKAIRFCPDEWIKDIWPPRISESEGGNYRENIEQLQWKIGKNILKSGVDIIIEWGTWGRNEREKLRDEAWEIGSKVKFYYLDEPKDVLKERIINRNKDLGKYEFYMPEDQLDEDLDNYFKQFQPPSEVELRSYDFLGLGNLEEQINNRVK